MRPEQAGLHSGDILKYIKMLEREHLSTHDMIIARGDEILFECYWEPFTPDFQHRMYSVTKSVVAIGIGFLEQDGLIDLDDPIGKYFPEEIKQSRNGDLHRQTIRDMLIMCTARQPLHGGNWFGERTSDRVKYYFTESEAYSRTPGTTWEYDSTGSFILGSLIERLTGMSFMDYMRIKLFDKIGVSREACCLKCPGGHSWTDSGLLCTPKDIMKIGRFLLNGGSWNGVQLLNKEFVKAATTRQSDNDILGTGDWNAQGYGYQIWMSYQGAFMFCGMGCQLVICVPDKDIVFVINGDNQGNAYAMGIIVRGFFEYIVNRIRDNELPDDGAYEELVKAAKHLKLEAAKGEEYSPLEDSIHGVTYELERNPMGITAMRLEFTQEGGILYYTNAQGDKELPFGRCANCFCDFPEEGYSDLVGSVSEPGHKYHAAVSGAWHMPDKLFISVQIIDKYFGRANFNIGFTGDRIGVYMNKCAEDFLQTYEGYATGKRR